MIKWKIVNVDIEPTANGREKVVVVARWVCQAFDGNRSGVQMGATSLGAPGNTFVEFKDLTEETILGFCWANGLDKDAVEAKANAELQKLLESTVVTSELPWQTLQINNV